MLGQEAAALAVVSAVIVVQVTSWQTVLKSIERVLGVFIGVSLAIFVSHFFGLSIWTITLMIFFAQAIGLLLQNRGQYLATQIPISAALVLVLGLGSAAEAYPLLRLQGALVGGLIGTILSLLLSPPVYVFRARDAVVILTNRLAEALPRLAAALAGHLSEAESREVYISIQRLEQRVSATEQAYALGLDSARLNPWAHRVRRLLVDYPDMLLALERLVRQMRRIAYTLNEPDPAWAELAQKQEWALDYARLLVEIGHMLEEIATSIRVSTTPSGGDQPAREAFLARVKQAQQEHYLWQEQLTQDAKQAGSQKEYVEIEGSRLAIRGSILTDLRRMLDEVHDITKMVVSSSPHTA